MDRGDRTQFPTRDTSSGVGRHSFFISTRGGGLFVDRR